MPSPSSIVPRRVVVVGGGIAALEALLALSDLGDGRLDLTLVAPNESFVLSPMTVAVPFSAGHATEVPLADVCARFDADLHRAPVVQVDPESRLVRCADGVEVSYDALIVATGARAVAAYRSALTFFAEDPVAINGLLHDIDQGYCESVAVVVPRSGSWALPAYELALMIGREAADAGISDMPVHLVTPEPAAMAIFGPAGSTAVQQLLDDAGVQLHTDAFASVGRGGRITMMPGERRLQVARVLALPRLEGRRIDGLPIDERGFVPIDEHARVVGLDDVYAAGDGTDFPIKQGGLATQQADAAARHIAARAGAPVDPEPFRPVLRGMLLTGGRPRFLRNEPAGGRGEGTVDDRSLWWPPVKVVGRYLSPWLAGEEGLAPKPVPEDERVEIEVPLRHDRESDPLALLARP
jgi:sulfide:quinone oxidoreductase